MNTEKAIRNLKLRSYAVQHFATGAEAADYLAGQIRDTTVGIGGSMTVQQLGLYETLSEHNEVFWHWKTPGWETLEKANHAAVYITSVNAMTEGGEMLNIDGRGNRLAGQVFGRKKVYFVVGVNKLCPDFESALSRAHNTAAVTNCKRFPNKPPCQIDDKCHDCRSPERICRALLVLWAPMMDMECEVILIDESLGY